VVGDAIAVAGLDVTVEARVRCVQAAVAKPGAVGWIPLQADRRLLEPAHRLRRARQPEPVKITVGLLVHGTVLDHRLSRELRWRRKRPALLEQDVDRLVAHGVYSNSSSSFDIARFATTTAPTATAPAAAALAARRFLDVVGLAASRTAPCLISLAA